MSKQEYMDPPDDWTVTKLVGVVFVTLSIAFAIIYTISP